jgi:hypothetical protein
VGGPRARQPLTTRLASPRARRRLATQPAKHRARRRIATLSEGQKGGIEFVESFTALIFFEADFLGLKLTLSSGLFFKKQKATEQGRSGSSRSLGRRRRQSQRQTASNKPDPAAASEDPRPVYLARNIHFGLHFLHQHPTNTSHLRERVQHWIQKAASRREWLKASGGASSAHTIFWCRPFFVLEYSDCIDRQAAST